MTHVEEASPSRMSDEEAVAILNELELTERLFDIRLGEWCVWPLFKMEVMLMLTGLSFSGKGGSLPKAWRMKSAASDIIRLAAARKRDIVIKTGTATLIDRVGAKYKDLLFDDLAAALGDVHKIETVIDASHVERARSSLIPATLSTSAAELIGGVVWRMSRDAQADTVAARISQVLVGKLGFAQCTPSWAAIRLRHFDATRKVYKAILQLLARNTLIVGDPGEFGAVAAARELGLHTVEVQHGLLNANHPAYAWGSAPKESWHCLPVTDRLFAFGRYWRETLSEIPFWKNRIDVTGSLRMDSYRGKVSAGHSSKREVVLTTQGIDAEPMARFVREARSLQRDADGSHIVVKLHPAWDDSKELYTRSFAGDAGVEVRLASEGDATLELLTRASLHVSISSFCHYEACALGVQTVVLPFHTSESMRPMVEAGHASLADTPEKLAEFLDGRAEKSQSGDASTYYFEPGALPNMLAALSRLDSAAA